MSQNVKRELYGRRKSHLRIVVDRHKVLPQDLGCGYFIHNVTGKQYLFLLFRDIQYMPTQDKNCHTY